MVHRDCYFRLSTHNERKMDSLKYLFWRKRICFGLDSGCFGVVQFNCFSLFLPLLWVPMRCRGGKSLTSQLFFSAELNKAIEPN